MTIQYLPLSADHNLDVGEIQSINTGTGWTKATTSTTVPEDDRLDGDLSRNPPMSQLQRRCRPLPDGVTVSYRDRTEDTDPLNRNCEDERGHPR